MYPRMKIAIGLFLIFALAVPTAAQEDHPYRISLGSVTFVPAIGQTGINRPCHFILQFHEIPSLEQLNEMAHIGIDVQRYIGGNAYIGHATGPKALDSLALRRDIRAAAHLTAGMRLDPAFQHSRKLRKAILHNEMLAADVRFHADVPFEKALNRLRSAGIACEREYYLAANRLVVEALWSSLQALLEADEVDIVEPALLCTKLLNLGGSRRMGVDRILRKPKFHRPDGGGVLVGITDAWIVDENHVEFGGRVTVLHDINYIERPTEWAALNHATTVAGNLAAGGIRNPLCRGPAPSARILSMVIPFDPVNEIKYAAKNLGLRISSNSWGYDPEDEILPPVRIGTALDPSAGALKSRFGYYPSFNYAMDQMVRKADVLYFWAAGNESSSIVLSRMPDEMNRWRIPDKWHRSYPGFDTMLINPSAKNILAIGAAHKDDVICAFSSRGPGYDGRIGPHLVAPGFDLLSIASEDTYVHGSGTSGSCPMAAGVAALLIDQYRKIHKADPGSALIKALLINSARDLGLKGPDYTYGYGMVDAQLAARTISGQDGIEEVSQVRSRFVEDNIRHKETNNHTFSVPRNKKELRVTLVWHDLPGKKLINNLDLWVQFGNEKKILPLTPDPNNPLAPAVNQRNRRDTSEHIVVKNPVAGDWTIVVKGKKIPKGRQDYALVIAAGKGNAPPVRKNKGDFLIHRVLPSKGSIDAPVYTFKVGDPVFFHALVNVLDNASYADGFYGTMSVRFDMYNESGELTFVLSGSLHNMAPCQPGEYRNLYWGYPAVPEEVPKGTFRVRTTVTMHNGITKTAPEEFVVTIE